MAYDAKTDWLPDDPINEDDVNRWEKGIQDAHKDLAVHKNDMNNPHNTTKAQIGLGNVDNVQQASKKNLKSIVMIYNGTFHQWNGRIGMQKKQLSELRKKRIRLYRMQNITWIPTIKITI